MVGRVVRVVVAVWVVLVDGCDTCQNEVSADLHVHVNQVSECFEGESGSEGQYLC